MRLRFLLLFTFYALLFLFYPGDTYLFKTFAQHRNLFETKEKSLPAASLKPFPAVKLAYYPTVSADGIYVVELETFTPVIERNSNQVFLPASTTKILVALVAIDIYSPDEIISVKRIVSEGQVMGLQEGEKISVENLLYGILVHSGNDAAYALADNFGYDRFIDHMNKKALSIGMKHTLFKNPAGLDDYSQYTTPFDLALASRKLLKNKFLSKIVSTKEITISDNDFKIFHKLSNVNKLLGEIQGIGGLKTGYTENALENLVTLYKKDGHEFIIVILKSQDRFGDTKNIVRWIDENITYIY